MSRALAISLKRPHEQLGLPMPFARRLADIKNGTWMACMVVGVLVCVGLYVYQVNAAASKSFELRRLEKQVERLQDAVSSLDYKITELQSISSLDQRVQGMGYIPLTQVQYISVQTARAGKQK